MTPEDRFQRIEGTLQAAAESQLSLQASFGGVQKAIGGIQAAVEGMQVAVGGMQVAIGGLIEAHTRNQETLRVLTESFSRYTVAADARMTRIEVNLDGLIRAITAEHGNGKSQH